MTIGKLWQDYWFRPAALFNLAVCRITCVAAQLVSIFLDHDYLMEHAGLPDHFYDPLPIVRLILWPISLIYGDPLFRPSYESISIIHFVAIGAGFFALTGALTRISLPLFAFGSLFLHSFRWSFGDFHHPDAVLIIFLCVLSLSPAGKSLSVDDLLSRMRGATQRRRFETPGLSEATNRFASFPLLLGQVLLALIYLNAALAKLWVSGLDWMNGYTLQYYLFRDGAARGSEIAAWLGQHHILAVLLSWLTMIFEGAFPLVLFVPSLVWVFLPLGLILHLGMASTNLAFFYQYLALYTVFVPWDRVVSWARGALGNNKLQVVFDGECLLCIRSMTFVSYWDWFDRLAYTDLRHATPDLAAAAGGSLDAGPAEMLAVWPSGLVRKGFFAWRDIVWRLPALWPLLPLLWLPGMSLLGPKVYQKIAAARARFQSCENGVCYGHDRLSSQSTGK